MKLIFALVVFWSFIDTSFAENCSYTVFRPDFLRDKLLSQMHEKGIGSLTKRLSMTSDYTEEITLYRDNMQVGQIAFENKFAGRTSEITVKDAYSNVIFHAAESSTNFGEHHIDLGSTSTPASPASYLSVTSQIDEGTFHYVNGKDVGITLFYVAFDQYWHEMTLRLIQLNSAVRISFHSPMEEFQFAIQLDPSIAPYIDYFHALATTSGVEISGSVPTFGAYQRVLLLAQRIFGVEAQVHLTIDGRLRTTQPTEARRECMTPGHFPSLYDPALWNTYGYP